jgi:restriction system protein
MEREMKRKKRGLFDEIAASPWWVGVAFGVIGYPVLRWLVPWLVIEHPLLKGIAGGMEVVALVWLMACFGASGLSLLHGLLRRSLYERTRDADDLSGLSWQHFEKLVGEYFRRQGFQVRETGSPAGENGMSCSASTGRPDRSVSRSSGN